VVASGLRSVSELATQLAPAAGDEDPHGPAARVGSRGW
jgi:hypothetical protein